jgi:hypothetical protein
MKKSETHIGQRVAVWAPQSRNARYGSSPSFGTVEALFSRDAQVRSAGGYSRREPLQNLLPEGEAKRLYQEKQDQRERLAIARANAAKRQEEREREYRQRLSRIGAGDGLYLYRGDSVTLTRSTFENLLRLAEQGVEQS